MAGLKWRKYLVTLLGAALVCCVLYTTFTVNWVYASGERAGYLLKLSRKGVFCKTWEGELQQVSVPGAVPEKFFFTVPADEVAQRLNEVMGKQVALSYEQHVGIPSSCFGDTSYFVNGVKLVAP